jgi:hypothetical protein
VLTQTPGSRLRPQLTCTVPDNYTDETTFLDHLQRNPRLQPYEFWSLMSDATVIVQHLATVVIFCCCFVAIIHDRVSPVAVVGWATLCTVLAWFLWDHWMGQEFETVSNMASTPTPDTDKAAIITSPALPGRTQQRLATAKSALLIYAALLGLSPILKSLTRSTTSDSIWALSTWLLMMNVAFFDYSAGTGAQYEQTPFLRIYMQLSHVSTDCQLQYPRTQL